MALDFPNDPGIGDEFSGGGFTWVWTGITWSKVAPATASAANDFALLVGTSGDTTYVLGRTYSSGRYTISFLEGDTTYDIYFIATGGTLAGYTNGSFAEVLDDFTEIVVLGADAGETILFGYQGALIEPSSTGDVASAGAFIDSVSITALPDIDDFTVVDGGNFAADVAVAFIGQDEVARAAKSVARSSSTELLAIRPDEFPVAQSPYSVRVLNPGIPAPVGTNSHILSNAVSAGEGPVWVTDGDLIYNIGGTTTITLVATDAESSVTYSVVTGTIPAGLTLDGATGIISGTFTGTADEGDRNSVTFRATDAGGNLIDKSLDFVANAAPVWTTPAGELDPSPILDEEYSFQLQASTGLAGGALTYTLVSGALLTGHTLSSTGLISGTSTDPTDTVANFTVRVTDEGGLFAERAFSTTVSQQPYWISTLGFSGNEVGINLALGPENELYTIGYTSSVGAGSNDIFLAKQDLEGNVQWQRALGGSGSDLGNGIATDSLGNVYIVGTTNSSGAGQNDIYFAKYNSLGTIQWQRTLGLSGQENGLSIAVDSLDDIYIAGHTSSTGAGSQDFFIGKYASDSSSYWSRTFGGSSSDIAEAVALDSLNNVYVVGYTNSAGQGGNDFLLVKYSSSGTLEWQRTLGSTGSDTGRAIAIDSLDNVYIAGNSDLGGTGFGSNDGLIAKYNPSGTLQWQKAFGGTLSDIVYGLATDSLNNIYASVTTNSTGAGNSEGMILKLDASGTVEWQRSLGGVGSETLRAVKLDSLDNLYVFGSSNSAGEGGNDFFLSALPSDGSLIGAYQLNGVPISYRQSSLSVITSSLTSGTPSLTSNSVTLTDAAANFTSSAVSGVLHKTEGTPFLAFNTDATLPAAFVGTSYSAGIEVSRESMSTSISMEIISGSLPSGISLDLSTGLISGTSTETAGTASNFTVRVTSSTGLVIDGEFTLPTVMAARMSNVTVVNVAPYTHQYYVISSSRSVTVLQQMNNCSMVLVGGGASGSYSGQGSVSTTGGRGGTVTFVSSLNIAPTTSNATIGSGGSNSFNSNNNPGAQTSFLSYSAAGGSGGTTNAINGSTAGNQIMEPIAPVIFTAQHFIDYTGLDTGHLGGSGSGGTSSTQPRPAGLGGGGTGFFFGGSTKSGLQQTGGGGDAPNFGGSAGGIGGSGVVAIKVPNQ